MLLIARFLTADDQKKMDANYDSIFFSPWHRSKAFYSKETVEAAFKKYRDNPGYAENRRKHDMSWMIDLAANAHLQNYPNACFAAITIDNSDLRVLPTHKPRFYESNTDRGFPFDSLQESSVAANTPVFISHVTKDKAWVLAETPYAVGWISARNIARVDGNFVRMWERGQYAVVIKDKIPIYDEEGRFLFKVPLGSVYPKVEEDTQNIKLLVAVTDQDGQAFMKRAIVSKEEAASKPLRLTSSNIAKLANELINESLRLGRIVSEQGLFSYDKGSLCPVRTLVAKAFGRSGKRRGHIHRPPKTFSEGKGADDSEARHTLSHIAMAQGTYYALYWKLSGQGTRFPQFLGSQNKGFSGQGNEKDSRSCGNYNASSGNRIS